MNTLQKKSKILLLICVLIAIAPTAVRAERSGCPMMKRAAEQGDPDRQFLYAQALDKGYCGFKIDKKKAFQWYKKSAEQGNVEADRAIGRMYLWGKGVKRSTPEALKWLHKAADRGDNHAQAEIGRIYENGWGVKKDLVQAYMWYSLTHTCSECASVSLDQITGKMTSKQIAEAKQLAAKWKPTKN